MSKFQKLVLDEQIEDLEEVLLALSNGKEDQNLQSEQASQARLLNPSGEQFGTHSPIDAEVQILDLKDIYDKEQKKTFTGSEQRIVQSKVHMAATTPKQIAYIRVYIQRCPEAIKKTHDTIGPIELRVSYQEQNIHQTNFSVNLDSVYKNENGELIYWLDKVEVQVRNMWSLVIKLEFADGSQRHFQSKSFRIRTKPRQHKKSSRSASSEETAPLARLKAETKRDINCNFVVNQDQKCEQYEETIDLPDDFFFSLYTDDFADLPMLWTSDEDVPLDRIVPSLELYPPVF